MPTVEALVLQLARKGLGVRAQGQEPQQQRLVTRLFTLSLQFLEVVGVADLLAALIAAGVGSDELFVVEEQQLIGIELERQLLGSVEMGD